MFGLLGNTLSGITNATGTFAGLGTFLGGTGTLFSALDSAFGSGRKNVKIAEDNLNLAKNQFQEENRRYNQNQANLQANSDMLGSIFSDSQSVWNRD